MFAGAAVAAGSSVVSGIGSALSSYDKEKDQHRRDTNARMEALARTGNKNAYRFLLARSGRAGTITINEPFGDQAAGAYSGWASEPAREDAYKRYKLLQPILEPATQFDGHESPDEIVADREQQQRIANAGGWGIGVLVLSLLIGALVFGGKRTAAAA